MTAARLLTRLSSTAPPLSSRTAQRYPFLPFCWVSWAAIPRRKRCAFMGTWMCSLRPWRMAGTVSPSPWWNGKVRAPVLATQVFSIGNSSGDATFGKSLIFSWGFLFLVHFFKQNLETGFWKFLICASVPQSSETFLMTSPWWEPAKLPSMLTPFPEHSL